MFREIQLISYISTQDHILRWLISSEPAMKLRFVVVFKVKKQTGGQYELFFHVSVVILESITADFAVF